MSTPSSPMTAATALWTCASTAVSRSGVGVDDLRQPVKRRRRVAWSLTPGITRYDVGMQFVGGF